MARQPARLHSARDTVLLLVCLTLSLTALLGPREWGDAVGAGLRRTVAVPLLWLQERAEESRTSQARFRALASARDSVAVLAQGVPMLHTENDRLRALLGLGRRMTARYVPAEVLHQALPTDGRTLLLSAGGNDGVLPLQPVVAPEGLVGVTRSVGPHAAVVMTWTHPEFRVSAFTQGGETFGIVAPSVPESAREPLLELRGVPYRDSVPDGTVVLSSGVGGVFPKGIPIGTVIGVAREATGWERVYQVRPTVNPGTVSHVLVLTQSSTWPADSVPDDADR